MASVDRAAHADTPPLSTACGLARPRRWLCLGDREPGSGQAPPSGYTV
jgi:hypothetical protein